MVERWDFMYIVVLHKHSFTQTQYIATSISFSDNTYTIVTTTHGTVTFNKDHYIVAILD